MDTIKVPSKAWAFLPHQYFFYKFKLPKIVDYNQCFFKNCFRINFIECALYVSFIIFFTAMILITDFYIKCNYFVYLLPIISFFPIDVYLLKNRAGNVYLALSPSFKNIMSTIKPIKSGITQLCLLYIFSISLATCIYPYFSVEWFFVIVKFSILVASLILVTSRLVNVIPDFVFNVYLIFVLVSCVNALINLYYYFAGLENIWAFSNIRFTPTVGHIPDSYPTTAGLFYALNFVVSILLAASIKKSHIIKFLMFIISFIFLFCIVLTQSRGPLLASIGSLMTIAFLSAGRMKISYLIILCSLAIIYFSIPKIGIDAIDRGLTGRLMVWKTFLQLAMERPIFGYGERIEFQLLHVGHPIGHAHNLFLSSQLRGGLLACIALISIFASSLISSHRLLKNKTQSIPFGVITTCLLSGLVDFDLLIFLPDWQWYCFWLPISICIVDSNNRNYVNSQL
jgi:hypothetical protein